jgi:hypothetical protein
MNKKTSNESDVKTNIDVYQLATELQGMCSQQSEVRFDLLLDYLRRIDSSNNKRRYSVDVPKPIDRIVKKHLIEHPTVNTQNKLMLCLLCDYLAKKGLIPLLRPGSV